MSVKSYFKKRNWTRKSFTSFQNQLFHHLTPAEYAELPFNNDLETFRVNIHIRPTRSTLVKRLSREIQKEIKPSQVTFSEFIQESDKETGYIRLKEQGCTPSVVLDFHWAKKFPYFHVASQVLSPSGEKWLLAIDFVGNQSYHLFTKSLYADDYRRIQLPEGVTPNVLWLDNARILYVSIHRDNEHGLYLYHLDTKKHKLLYKNQPGCFIRTHKVNSGLYLLLYSSNYHSDEVYVMDLETLKVHLLLSRQFSVNYPYLNHEIGQWIVCKRDKNKDLLATTSDFKRWNIHYQNKNPYEQILNVFYQKDWFVFILETLSGLCLYSLKCKTLLLLDKSFDGYEMSHVDAGEIVVYRHKYTCPKQPIRISIENPTAILPKMKPRYHEEVVFIHPHLRVTLLYKHKTLNAPCLLRGYGAYNEYTEVRESVFYYPLLERGFVIAIAHLRGGGEYGYRGYDQGRMSHKKNTFQDFIDTAHYLIDKKWTCRDKLAIWGRSFGGLLISAVLNQEPELCKVALLGVPFVQPLEMKSDKMPVGIATQSELGNIQDPKVKDYVRSYSPLEHIQKEGQYPHLFIYTNRHDTSVPCQGPIAYYNAMKQTEVYRTGKRDITLYLDPRFGHNQGSLQKDKCDHYGLLFAYVLKYLNIL